MSASGSRDMSGLLTDMEYRIVRTVRRDVKAMIALALRCGPTAGSGAAAATFSSEVDQGIEDAVHSSVRKTESPTPSPDHQIKESQSQEMLSSQSSFASSPGLNAGLPPPGGHYRRVQNTSAPHPSTLNAQSVRRVKKRERNDSIEAGPSKQKSKSSLEFKGRSLKEDEDYSGSAARDIGSGSLKGRKPGPKAVRKIRGTEEHRAPIRRSMRLNPA